MNRIQTFALAGVAAIALTAAVGAFAPAANAQMKEETKMVGGAAMYPSKNIVQNAVNSKDHTTLVAARWPGRHATIGRPIHGVRADQ
jgi:uncharacterized surface protein with fasciclin (FAS1) repeats